MYLANVFLNNSKVSVDYPNMLIIDSFNSLRMLFEIYDNKISNDSLSILETGSDESYEQDFNAWVSRESLRFMSGVIAQIPYVIGRTTDSLRYRKEANPSLNNIIWSLTPKQMYADRRTNYLKALSERRIIVIDHNTGGYFYIDRDNEDFTIKSLSSGGSFVTTYPVKDNHKNGIYF